VVLEVLPGAVDVVGLERAARAGGVPIGVIHQVMDDELAAPLEEVGERLPAFRRVEYIRLLDLHPGQRTPFRAQAVTRPHVLLLLDQERRARRQPFVP
jgi:hypothetical protein